MAEKQNQNLLYYELLRKVPKEAIKTIEAGRLKGFSDINPMYRIKAMTEAFGPCGIGWKYEIVKQWQEQFGQEVKSFTNINLYVKVDGEWSDAIPGTGGATIVEVNSKGYSYVNDEGHKMSLTDALGVAMKSLGVAADVYYSKDVKKFDSKYEKLPDGKPQQTAKDEELEEAFLLIKDNIEKAPSRQYLNDIHKQNAALHAYAPYRSLMNKRYKELQ